MYQKPKLTVKNGFALIATISILVLLMMVALSMVSISNVKDRSEVSQTSIQIARSNARMAMMIALGDLQKSAGHDQRVTATASILDNDLSNAPSDGHRHWTGVWDTTNYDPKDPNTKTFLRWLVSVPNETNATDIAYTNPSPATSDYTIFEGDTAANNVIVPKINVTDSTGNKGRYAYWIEDEGVKIDLGWNAGSFTDTEQQQAARLSAAPGPDYDTFQGPFTSQITYPIDETTNTWLTNMERSSNVADIPLALTSTDNGRDWLQENRHTITLRSNGVLSDTKLGGLRRDLSLAFEMDDDEEVENATNFNSRTGDFVGGSDRYAAPQVSPGMGTLVARHLYRDTPTSGSAFSGDIITTESIVRGPTWWALRDYANLYKRLSKSGNDYNMQARAYYPNRSAGVSEITENVGVAGAGRAWDHEIRSGKYLYRPARPSYAPTYLGMTCLVGVKMEGTRLALSIDPLFHFWNPYNIDITYDNIVVRMPTYTFPGKVIFWTKKSTETTETQHILDLKDFVDIDGTIATNTSFLLEGSAGSAITMKPGEVMVFSPDPITSITPAQINGTAKPGYFTTAFDSSGIITTNFSGAGEIDLVAGDEVGFVYTRGASGDGSNRNMVQTNLGAAGLTANNAFDHPGDGIQGYWLNLAPFTNGYNEYINSFADTNTEDAISVTSAGGVNANVDVNTMTGKRLFGLFAVLSKPSHYTATPADGSTVPSNPVEIFSRFNPLFYTANEDIWHSVPPNLLYTIVSSANQDDLLNGYGMGLSTQPRNAFWGAALDSNGSTSVPMLNIPTRPLISLASFSDANISSMAGEPMRAVGNSWSSPFFSPTSAYGKIRWHHADSRQDLNERTGTDISWLLNDILFDRYYLSGLAPDFTIDSSGYSTNSGASLTETITNFFSADHQSANANPLLKPYIPHNTSASSIITELSASDGYLKMGAYSLISGAFNVNSTSVTAWAALLRSNKDLAITYAQELAVDSPSSDTPFPNSPRPVNPTPSSGLSTQPEWAGHTRLSDAQINDLAEKIVAQVKLRGPFMSLSDFINHRLGTIDSALSYTGAIQAALDNCVASSNINTAARTATGSTTPDYSSNFFQGDPPSTTVTTSGIPGEITQADILRPLAPRLSARSDTFKIRAYGEALNTSGDIVATATCEVVVQRIPQYVDTKTDASNNEPWDEAFNPISDPTSTINSLNQTNQNLGRRFKIVSFQWINN